MWRGLSTAKNDVMLLLGDLLSPGPMSATLALETIHYALGASERTIRQAKKELGVVSYQEGGGWMWRL